MGGLIFNGVFCWKATIEVGPHREIEAMLLNLPDKCATSVATTVDQSGQRLLVAFHNVVARESMYGYIL